MVKEKGWILKARLAALGWAGQSMKGVEEEEIGAGFCGIFLR